MQNADDFAYVRAPKEAGKEKPEPIKPTNQKVPPKKESELPTGYCIRTGKHISFNLERPMTYDAWKEWSKFSNPDFKEKFCHFSGEPSNGETSFNKPILKKNWKKAKETFSL